MLGVFLAARDGIAIAWKGPIRDSTKLPTDSPISLEMVEQYLRKEGVNCCAYVNTMHSLSHQQVERGDVFYVTSAVSGVTTFMMDEIPCKLQLSILTGHVEFKGVRPSLSST